VNEGGYAEGLDDEELAFQRLYGPWDPLTPSELLAWMDGYTAPWWVVGGYAIEAFTAVQRHHEDIDLVIFAKDLPQLRRHVEGRFHLWSAGAGALRPVNDDWPEPHLDAGQVWLREHALAPWRVDCILNPDVGGRWQSKRDEAHVADLEDISWVAEDGIRYLDPEIALLFKAKLDRDKDLADLSVAWPLLSPDRQSWLRHAVLRLYPGHAWSDRLA
jgi:hypothetical protein